MKGATSIQERLWELRKDKGLNLEELSELTGISKSALGSYEKEDYKEINHGNLITLADFYGVSVDYLLCRTENREQINTPLTELHLNDEMVALLKSGRINNRLLCELATHKDFIKFLADIEIYVDGIATMQIQNLNALVDTVRHEIIERYRPGEDRLGEAVDIDIVIAAALHFCKLHFGHLLRGYEPARIGKTKPTWKGGNLMAIILIRTLIIFLALIVAMRLMGKRQLGELELSELVVAVLIADIASIPLQNPSLPLSYGLIPLLVLFCCELIFSGLTYKSIHLRKLLYGRPNFIIERGRIAQQAMHRNRFTLDELTQELRNQGILDIASVEYAVLETNGQLNIILAPAQQPVTAEQMHMETEDTGYFSILINNGRILRDNLKRMGRDERWLQKQVQQRGALCIADVYLLMMNDAGQIYFAAKELG